METWRPGAVTDDVPAKEVGSVINKQFTRRSFLKGIGLTGAAALLGTWQGATGSIAAEGCSQMAGQRVRWIVPYSSGGGYDTFSRLIEPYLEAQADIEVLVENRPGAGGMVGTKTLMDAPPDGRTVGILNATGLLIAALGGDPEAPDLLRDFTLLGRVSSYRHVWCASGESPFRTIDDLLDTAKKRPLLAAFSGIGGATFANFAICSHILDLDLTYVPGYAGSRQLKMAVLRGDVDISSVGFESALEMFEAGDLRPLLQCSNAPISTHPSLKEVAVLGGKDGVAVRRARQLNRDAIEAQADASALASLFSSGRLIAAPAGMPKSVFACLESALARALADPAFQRSARKAHRSLDTARAADCLHAVRVASQSTERFKPIVRRAMKRIRE
jgi:tripartite-type tricarboxylate transporter receptor subunit TctC